MQNLKRSRTATGWDKSVYNDEKGEPCIDLIVDAVKRQYLVKDIVCLFYHGPRPFSYSVVHIIDSSNPCTPDNVGWLSQGPDGTRNSTSGTIENESPDTQKFKRPLKRAKQVMKWDHLWFVDDDGALYLGGDYNGEWGRTLLVDYLSENYHGPWPDQDSYAFIIDLSKGCVPENIGWMTQNPIYRTVKYGD